MTDTPTEQRRRAPSMDAEQRRGMIVRAALPLVAEYGGAVTTRQIARAAGIGEGTIFRVFADKDAVLDACVAEALRPERTLEQLAAIPLTRPLPDRLVEAAAVLRAHLDRLAALLGALHATNGRAGARRTGAAPDRAAGALPVRRALAELMEPERELLRLPPDRLASLLLGLLFAGAGEEHPPSPAELVDVLLHGALTTTPEGRP
ncbi:TetR family transcriptional regulator [Kitasatospora griseola]|uniref:TetR family transcriptional regulator n=1 Tax=Kitasatospora griseola TaxID=2064 RepID=A0A0D0PSV6_KITGR|nr:TetR/AcrR family transcriptional regulator [Kitasatospora griseola]KIQ65609.1 TetR family transcriptional regulator [Kitasatospora griseola]